MSSQSLKGDPFLLEEVPITNCPFSCNWKGLCFRKVYPLMGQSLFKCLCVPGYNQPNCMENGAPFYQSTLAIVIYFILINILVLFIWNKRQLFVIGYRKIANCCKRKIGVVTAHPVEMSIVKRDQRNGREQREEAEDTEGSYSSDGRERRERYERGKHPRERYHSIGLYV